MSTLLSLVSLDGTAVLPLLDEGDLRRRARRSAAGVLFKRPTERKVTLGGVVEIGDDLKEGGCVEARKPCDEFAERSARVAEHLGVVRNEISVRVFYKLRGAPDLALGRGVILLPVSCRDEIKTLALGVSPVRDDRRPQKVRDRDHVAHEPVPLREHVGVEALQNVAQGGAAVAVAGDGVGVVDVPVAVWHDLADSAREEEIFCRSEFVHAAPPLKDMIHARAQKVKRSGKMPAFSLPPTAKT